MLDKTNTFECRSCGSNKTKRLEEDVPFCCGKKMSLHLEPCTGVHQEMYRNSEDEGTCDDGRGHNV